MKVFVVIPAYNEESRIAEVILSVHKFCSNIIVVDDGSFDATGSVALQEGAIVVRHIINRGQGAALQTGIQYALAQGGECIVSFDADGQHRAEDIPRLISAIASGEAEVVLGSRFKNPAEGDGGVYAALRGSMPRGRRIALKLGLFHQWIFSGLKVTDAQCGLRAFSRRAAETIVISQDRMAHSSEILDKIARYHLRFVEVPVSVLYTPYSLRKGQKSISGSARILIDFFIGRFVK